MRTTISQRLALAIVGSVIGIMLLLLVPCSTLPADTPTHLRSSITPELPLLTACEQVLTQLSPTVQVAKFSLKEVDLSKLEDIAWIDDNSLLVTTNGAPRNGDKQVPIYIYPLQGSPTYAKILADKKVQLGDATLFISRLKNKEGKVVTEVVQEDQTLSIAFTNNKVLDEVNNRLDLPSDLYVSDFGIKDLELGKKGHPDEFRIYNAQGKIVTQIQRPLDVFIYHPSQYYLGENKNDWILAVASAKTADEAKLVERAETDLVIISCSKTDGAVHGVRRINIGSSLLSASLKNLDVLGQRIEHFSTLDHPVYSTARQKWLFRKIEDITLGDERLTLAELWECNDRGANRQLLDIRGWYQGPDSHKYAFLINTKQLIEEYKPSINLVWGPGQEMIPAISPDGKQVAYGRNNAIQIQEVP